MSDWVAEIIDEIIHPRPFAVCICGKFKPGDRAHNKRAYQCANRGDWMTQERWAVDDGRRNSNSNQ